MTTHAAVITPTQTQPPPGATIDPDNVWVPVKQLPEHCPGESEGGARWAIFNENFNGLAQSGAVARRGRKVLVNPKRWIAWTRTNPTLSPPRPKAGQKVAPKARPQYRPQPVAVLAAERLNMDNLNAPGAARTGEPDPTEADIEHAVDAAFDGRTADGLNWIDASSAATGPEVAF